MVFKRPVPSHPVMGSRKTAFRMTVYF
uniref:Uncharacterized protein n=1 Tax=Anguilla anguilla TaxID=7936 RepID=A0A0E9UYP3_ANGAN